MPVVVEVVDMVVNLTLLVVLEVEELVFQETLVHKQMVNQVQLIQAEEQVELETMEVDNKLEVLVVQELLF
jgi:hypothetical protein